MESTREEQRQSHIQAWQGALDDMWLRTLNNEGESIADRLTAATNLWREGQGSVKESGKAFFEEYFNADIPVEDRLETLGQRATKLHNDAKAYYLAFYRSVLSLSDAADKKPEDISEEDKEKAAEQYWALASKKEKPEILTVFQTFMESEDEEVQRDAACFLAERIAVHDTDASAADIGRIKEILKKACAKKETCWMLTIPRALFKIDPEESKEAVELQYLNYINQFPESFKEEPIHWLIEHGSSDARQKVKDYLDQLLDTNAVESAVPNIIDCILTLNKGSCDALLDEKISTELQDEGDPIIVPSAAMPQVVLKHNLTKFYPRVQEMAEYGYQELEKDPFANKDKYWFERIQLTECLLSFSDEITKEDVIEKYIHFITGIDLDAQWEIPVFLSIVKRLHALDGPEGDIFKAAKAGLESAIDPTSRAPIFWEHPEDLIEAERTLEKVSE